MGLTRRDSCSRSRAAARAARRSSPACASPTVIGVGTATIAAAIGAGGLGEFIFRGLSMVDPTVILAGAIPAAVLALVADGLLALVERAGAPATRAAARCRARGARARRRVAAAPASPIPSADGGRRHRRRLEELHRADRSSASWSRRRIERTTEPRASTRKLNLGGTLDLRHGAARRRHRRLRRVLRHGAHGDLQAARGARPGAALAIVRERYAATGRDGRPAARLQQHVRDARSRRRRAAHRPADVRATPAPHARTLAGRLRLRVPRAARTAFAGLARRYGLRSPSRRASMDLSLIYRALAAGRSTSSPATPPAGLIPALDLAVLEDDRKLLPALRRGPGRAHRHAAAAPVAQQRARTLAGRIDETTMRRMNAAVDVDKRAPSEVVVEALDGWLGRQ